MPEYCVTGGTGFIAAYLIKALLLKGHIVRTTVRDPSNAEKVGFLWELEGAKERLKIMKADLLVEGSFDDAIQGVDGVFHTASPVLVPYDDNIQLWYAYAKTKAEKEAWRVAEECGIDLVVVNPSFVVGPLLAPQPTSTLQIILGTVKGMIGEYANRRLGFVHIEDVVGAHILVMEEQKASGRYICSNSVRHMSQINDLLRTKYPSYPHENKCGNQQGEDIPHSLDTSKITQLGLPPLKSLNEMFDDCIQSFQEKGFL
ncbi:tetraketide alpha-pyrone reductase 2-like isoform X2 [Solanum stenotomum]|uniref:tetraketide alpha-pyrone reductase 2-like isoform X2 n=1 Tax=Solanum stenotomum TaxID=172797 RepID=UPI0020CFF491|nr:tetraketide alpha-pyrone reductase 2-like isoform X2 [Solanum stenotomum]